jgi:hypothetical protein
MHRFSRALRCIGAKSWLLQTLAAVVALSGPVFAADWSLNFGASESLSLNDNIDLDEFNRDAGLITFTSFNFDLLGKARTYEIEFTPVLGWQKTYFSQDPDDDKWSFLPSAALDFRKSGKRTDYDLLASFARTEANSDELLEGIASTNEGDQLTYLLGATLTHKVNEQNSLVWANTATMVDFTEPSADLVPYVDLNSTGTWRRQLTELVASDFLVGVEYYNPDSISQSASMIYRSRVGLDARLTKRLSVNGNVGVALQDPVDSGPTLGPIFNIAADYKLKTTSYSLSAGRDLSPDLEDGILQSTLTASLGVSHQVNDLTTVGVAVGYSIQSGSGDPTTSALIITPTLNYQLSQDWQSALSYQFIQSDDAGTPAHSHAVSLTFSYGTVLLP